MTETVHQVSSGGVIYRERDGVIEVALVLSNPKRYWQLPKGRVEEGESLETTALREIHEETGLRGTIVKPIDTIDYWFQRKRRDGTRTRFHKVVHFFLVRYESGELETDWENIEARWVDVDSAETMLSFKNAKTVLAKAKALLQQPLPAKRTNTLRIASWNVNGLRAVAKKGFSAWLMRERPHILAVQEIKATPDTLAPSLTAPEGYFAYFSSAEKPGYAGTAIYTRSEPQNITLGMGIAEFDAEGRTQIAEFRDFVLVNGYFPNGSSKPERQAYKMRYKVVFLEMLQRLRSSSDKPLIVCGDLNTAHRTIDVARPKTKKNKSGFLEVERNWIDDLLDVGFVDSFRQQHPEQGETFTCWPYSRNSRMRNIGWRLDYIFVDTRWEERIVSAECLTNIYGSDHCPALLHLQLPPQHQPQPNGYQPTND